VKRATALRPFHGLVHYFYLDPGARAPGFMLSPASQALLCRTLSIRLDIEAHAATHHFFQRNARRFVFLRIDLNPRGRTTLQLFAALRGEDYHSVLRINFLAVRLVNFTLN